MNTMQFGTNESIPVLSSRRRSVRGLVMASLMAVVLPLAQAGGDREQWRNLADVPPAQRNPVAKERTWPSAVGEADICLWKDDKVAAFSITIDDNTKPDHAWWLEQGKKYGFRFTWFVVTGNVGGPNAGIAGTWRDFQALVDAGHDVQSHSVTHRSGKKDPNPIEDDYGAAIAAIQENLKGVRCLTMAYPGGGLTNDPVVAAKFYAGVRGTAGVQNSPSPNYLNTASIGSAASAFIEPGEKGSWASILGVAEQHPKAPRSYRAWYCMHFHGVHWLEQARSKIEEPLVKLLDYVKEKENLFWVALFREVILYGQERDTAKLSVTKVNDQAIELSLTDRMYDDWYDFPLTLKVRISNEWAAVSAAQDGKPVPVAVVEHEGGKYALVQAVPDRGDVVLQPVR